MTRARTTFLRLWFCALAASSCDADQPSSEALDTESATATAMQESDSPTDSPTATETDTDTGSSSVAFTLLSYNVGNPNSDSPHYPLRMSVQAYEDYIASQIAQLEPDIVLLQEVLSRKTCEAFEETDPDKTCYGWGSEPQPAARLLGPDYTVVCDARDHVECLGVRTSFGLIEGREPGAYLEDGAFTPQLPLPACVWAEGECTDSGCDSESTVSSVTVETAAGPLRLVHMHPSAQVSATISGDPCRALQLEQVFRSDVLGLGEPGVVEGFPRAIVAGDWNVALEVYDVRTWWKGRADEVWRKYVDCKACAFASLDPETPDGVRYSTTSSAPDFLPNLGLPIALDHVVVSEGLSGSCVVHDSAGMPGTVPLDAGYDGLLGLAKDTRIDHYALSCALVMTPAN